jgi:hypothetical protein
MTVPPEGSKEMSLDEIRKAHQSMWVAITVTKRDENGQPVAGKFVAEDPDRYRLRDQIYSYTDICIFFTGEPQFPLFL